MRMDPTWLYRGNRFSIYSAAYLARCSWLAYSNNLDNFRAQTGLASAQLIEDKATDSQALILQDLNHSIIAFRGTEISKYQDVATDLNASLSPWRFGYVHGGAKRAWTMLKDRVLAEIPANKLNHRLFFTGHSLGGMIAHIAATDVWNLSACYSFGAPPVGDVLFSIKLDELPVWRCYRAADPIPLIGLPGSVHSGVPVAFIADYYLIGGQISARDMAEAAADFKASPNLLENHSVEGYCNLTESIAGDKFANWDQ